VRLWRSRLRFYAKHGSRYGRVHNGVLRIVLGGWLRIRKADARRRFDRGEITDQELAAELTAYGALSVPEL
jgi:hypothetical protein